MSKPGTSDLVTRNLLAIWGLYILGMFGADVVGALGSKRDNGLGELSGIGVALVCYLPFYYLRRNFSTRSQVGVKTLLAGVMALGAANLIVCPTRFLGAYLFFVSTGLYASAVMARVGVHLDNVVDTDESGSEKDSL